MWYAFAHNLSVHKYQYNTYELGKKCHKNVFCGFHTSTMLTVLFEIIISLLCVQMHIFQVNPQEYITNIIISYASFSFQIK